MAFSLKLTVQVNQELNVRYQTVLKMYGTLEQRLIYVMVLNYVFERVVTTIELCYVILQSYNVIQCIMTNTRKCGSGYLHLYMFWTRLAQSI